jgi:glycosyltransferase involved in cell wall biosynthesis
MSVSVCIPTYNRKKFEKLIEYNINCQTYYNIREIVIIDDGDDEPLCIKTNYPIRYYRSNRITIGDKRNALVHLATSDYIAFMDTDDFYSSDYISHSIFEMETNNKSIAGSADMIMYHKDQYYKQRCMFIHMLNEATLVFKKNIVSKFSCVNSNEGVSFLSQNIKDIVETNIDRIMCCICHDANTISKQDWLKEQYKINYLSQYEDHKKILCSINLYEPSSSDEQTNPTTN